jgi:hypothetical protein
VRGRSQVEEKLSAGGAHREGWEDGGGLVSGDKGVMPGRFEIGEAKSLTRGPRPQCQVLNPPNW